MNIYLYGPDTFRSREQLKKMIAKFKADRDPQGLNVVTVDCRAEEPGKIMEQMLASPFLAEKRMVVLEYVLSATGKKDLQQEIFDRIKNKTIPESTVLLFWENGDKPKTDVAKKLHTILSKEKFAQEFQELKGIQFGNWIREQVLEHGRSIDSHALAFIADNVGSDMWRVHSLIEQLAAFTDTEVTIHDVQLFLDQKEDDNIFNLVDALVSGQSKRVYAMIREQYSKGEDAQYIFAMLLRQFRILLELRDVFEREDNPRSDDLAKRLGMHPFVVKKSLSFVRRYTRDQLKDVYEKLLTMDTATKTGGGDQSLLLDIFVGKMCKSS